MSDASGRGRNLHRAPWGAAPCRIVSEPPSGRCVRVICAFCDGLGSVPVQGEPVLRERCHCCAGRGYIITEEDVIQ